MKICKLCNKEKDLTCFSLNGKYKCKQKYKSLCKKCEKITSYERFKNIIKNFYGELKCSECGYDKCFSALDMHHREPTNKEKQLSKMVKYSEVKIIKELEKCDLLCSNYHREKHFILNNH